MHLSGPVSIRINKCVSYTFVNYIEISDVIYHMHKLFVLCHKLYLQKATLKGKGKLSRPPPPLFTLLHHSFLDCPKAIQGCDVRR